jgi:hypothetical protein
MLQSKKTYLVIAMDDNNDSLKDIGENKIGDHSVATKSDILEKVILEAQGNLHDKFKNEEMLKALLLSGELSISDMLDSDDIGEASAEKVAEDFNKKYSQEILVKIIQSQLKASKQYMLRAFDLTGKSIDLKGKHKLLFSKTDAKGNPQKIGDIVAVENGIAQYCRIFKSKDNCSIDPELLKNLPKNSKKYKAEYISVEKGKRELLDKLKNLFEKYRITSIEADQTIAKENAKSTLKEMSLDKEAVTLELIKDEKGGYKLDVANIKEETCVKLDHGNRNLDLLFLDKNGKIIDGIISEGSPLGQETREMLREAVFQKAKEGIDPNDRDRLAAAIDESRQAAGLPPIRHGNDRENDVTQSHTAQNRTVTSYKTESLSGGVEGGDVVSSLSDKLTSSTPSKDEHKIAEKEAVGLAMLESRDNSKAPDLSSTNRDMYIETREVSNNVTIAREPLENITASRSETQHIESKYVENKIEIEKTPSPSPEKEVVKEVVREKEIVKDQAPAEHMIDKTVKVVDHDVVRSNLTNTSQNVAQRSSEPVDHAPSINSNTQTQTVTASPEITQRYPQDVIQKTHEVRETITSDKYKGPDTDAKGIAKIEQKRQLEQTNTKAKSRGIES